MVEAEAQQPEEFPKYFKYPHEKTYFKVHTIAEFEEIHMVGKKYQILTVKAKTLPERNFLQDMLQNEKGTWIPITEEEFEKARQYCIENLALIVD